MKPATDEQTTALLAAFCKQYGARYAMPEMSGKPRFLPEMPGHVTAIFDVEPTGQMSSLVNKLEVRVTLFRDEMQEVEASQDKLLSVTVELNYQHPSMGRNGFYSNFVVFARRWDEEPYELCHWCDKQLAALLNANANHRAVHGSRIPGPQ